MKWEKLEIFLNICNYKRASNKEILKPSLEIDKKFSNKKKKRGNFLTPIRKNSVIVVWVVKKRKKKKK